MVDYTKSQAREWAKEHWKGAIAVTIPSYSADFSSINENAIRHDILKLKELGFAGHAPSHGGEHHSGGECAGRPLSPARPADPTSSSSSTPRSTPSKRTSTRWRSPRRRASTECCCRTRPPSGRPPSTRCSTTPSSLLTRRISASCSSACPRGASSGSTMRGCRCRGCAHVLDEIPNIVAIKAEQGYPGIARNHGDVPPLPRGSHHLVPHRGRDDSAHVGSRLPVLRYEQLELDERLLPPRLRPGPGRTVGGSHEAVVAGRSRTRGEHGDPHRFGQWARPSSIAPAGSTRSGSPASTAGRSALPPRASPTG